MFQDHRRPSVPPQPELSLDELSRIEAELLQTVMDRKADYAKAKQAAEQLTAVAQDIGLVNPDGTTAQANASKILQTAIRKYADAIEALNDFVLYQKLPEREKKGRSTDHGK